MVTPPGLADVRRISYLDVLDDDEALRFAESLSVFAVEPREFVMTAGDESLGFYVLRVGKARIFRSAPDGREQTLRVVAAGDTFGEVPVFDGGTAPSTVEALERCEVVLVPSGAFMTLLRAHPAVAQNVLRHFARRLRAFTEMVEQMSLQTVQARLARYLYQLAREEGVAGPEGTVVPRQLTLQDLASLLGSVREVVSRTMHSLEQDGVVEVRRHEIVVRDMQALVERV